ncbi:MAG: hypothetical protein M0Z61_13805 [Nitrospiraceae bacterium]|nr:hypothetical protein [Nitrospiraceae bacterium]
MKGEGIKLRFFKVLFLITFMVLGLAWAVTAQADDSRFLLKPDARMKICLSCHTDMADKLKSKYVHSALTTGGDCTVCHSPHTSSHGKLLADSVGKLCFTCHPDRIPANAKSTHKPVNEGKCILCHDPHATNNPFHLLKAGNEVCFQCHKNKKEWVAKVKFKHWPVDNGCTNCHEPHGSAVSGFLLKQPVPDLCLGCHKLDDPEIMKQHDFYPMQKAKCILCHNPHGSNQPGILYDNVHPPMAARMCDQCHEGKTSPTPFKLRATGYKLCAKCHTEKVKDIMGKNRVHWPLLSKKGCINCHSPHASPQKYLLKAPMKQLCGQCHADTIARQDRSKTKHKPVLEGKCTACHDPHSSNYAFLINQPAVANIPSNTKLPWATLVVNLCGQCHNWQQHSTHPVGDKVVDLRNKNTRVMCLSCHRVHGTDNKYMLHFWPITNMCTQCHKEFQR